MASLVVDHAFTGHSSRQVSTVRIDLGQWLDEAVAFAKAERAELERKRAINLARARERKTCVLGHPFLVYTGPTREGWPHPCGYCDTARHGFGDDR